MILDIAIITDMDNPGEGSSPATPLGRDTLAWASRQCNIILCPCTGHLPVSSNLLWGHSFQEGWQKV